MKQAAINLAQRNYRKFVVLDALAKYYTKETIQLGNDLIAFHRFSKNQEGIPVLLLHGSIENGKIFFTKSGKGLAPFLCEYGYDVFIPDMRGKGESTPAVDKNHTHSQTQQITEDIPAYLKKIEELRPFSSIHFVGHSWGGVLLLSYLARFSEPRVKSMVFFGSKRKIYVKSIRKFFMVDLGWDLIGQWAAKRKGYFPAKDWKYGSDNEPGPFYNQTHHWVESDEWIDPEDAFNYREALHSKDLPPALYFAGVKDRVLGNPTDVEKLMKETGEDQDNEMLLLGKSYGNRVDYGHIDMLTHPESRKDHFPVVVNWFRKHE